MWRLSIVALFLLLGPVVGQAPIPWWEQGDARRYGSWILGSPAEAAISFPLEAPNSSPNTSIYVFCSVDPRNRFGVSIWVFLGHAGVGLGQSSVPVDLQLDDGPFFKAGSWERDTLWGGVVEFPVDEMPRWIEGLLVSDRLHLRIENSPGDAYVYEFALDGFGEAYSRLVCTR